MLVPPGSVCANALDDYFLGFPPFLALPPDFWFFLTASFALSDLVCLGAPLPFGGGRLGEVFFPLF